MAHLLVDGVRMLVGMSEASILTPLANNPLLDILLLDALLLAELPLQLSPNTELEINSTA